MSRHPRLTALGLFAAAALLVPLCAWLFSATSLGVWTDTTTRGIILNWIPGPFRRTLDEFARESSLVALAAALPLGVLHALVKRRWAASLAALTVPFGAGLLVVVLRPQGLLGDLSGYPSTHATVGFALLIGLLMVWPRPVTRRGLLVAAALAAAIGVGNVSWYAHRPRDVLGSALVVASITFATVATFGPSSASRMILGGRLR